MVKSDKIQKTNVVFSSDLERSGGAVRLIRNAWDNLPEDIDMTEREMFIEISSRFIKLNEALREEQKDKGGIN